MPQSLVCLPVHFVFSTKGREPWIGDEWADRLYGYIGGIAHAEKCQLLAAGGMPDHIHLLISVARTIALADLMRVVKANSSKWVHETFPTHGAFAWQEGYSVFSVSKSQEEIVKKYIAGQAEHHKKEDFKSELLRILRAHGVECDQKHVFD